MFSPKSWLAGAALAAVTIGVGGIPSSALATVVGSASVSAPTVSPTAPLEDLFTLVSTGNGLSFSGSGTGSFSWNSGAGSLQGMGSDSNSIINNTSLNFGSLSSLVFSSPVGTFTAQSSVTIGNQTFSPAILGESGSAGSGSETVSVYEVGNFVAGDPATGTNLYPLSQTMSMTLAFTETAGSAITSTNLGSFSLSATVATPANIPPPPQVPEPASLAILGVAVLGLAAVRKSVA